MGNINVMGNIITGKVKEGKIQFSLKMLQSSKLIPLTKEKDLGIVFKEDFYSICSLGQNSNVCLYKRWKDE